MFEITRKRLAGILSAIAMTLVLVLVLATVAFAGGPVVHRVSVGGPDVCDAYDLPPGCDKNFSLSAREYADGSVKGVLNDQFGGDFGYIQAKIDCLWVEGNEAWVSGVITRGVFRDPVWGDIPLTGLAVGARVQDNGTTANDLPDRISPSIDQDHPDYDYAPCTAQPDYPLFDVPQGQVKVD